MSSSIRSATACAGWYATAICLVLILMQTTTPAAEEIVVKLDSGRTVWGTIDVRSDDNFLWLRREVPGIVLRSSFRWKHVASARRAGENLPVGKLRQLARMHAANAPKEGLIIPPPLDIAARGIAPPPVVDRLRPRAGDDRVRSLQVDAYVANWDDDIADDGLLVYVLPLAADGHVVPVSGKLELQLFGRALHGSRRRTAFPELGRLVQTVRATDFGPDGAVYKFPFRNFQPDIDLDVAIDGLLSARLSVPTQGTFHASDPTLRLRPRTEFRDALQLQRGKRFLPAENVRRRR